MKHEGYCMFSTWPLNVATGFWSAARLATRLEECTIPSVARIGGALQFASRALPFLSTRPVAVYITEAQKTTLTPARSSILSTQAPEMYVRTPLSYKSVALLIDPSIALYSVGVPFTFWTQEI
ncbi:hypothetical protein PM082_001964 [Marasmius tenuissimus]|nr:hypothetical protein PM082_001964 [Marasmius tenuissimus]